MKVVKTKFDPKGKSAVKHKCTICQRGFNSPKDLRSHVNAIHEGKRDFKCNSCGKCFGRVHTLNVHIQRSHGKAIGKYVCSYCERRFHTNYHLNSHTTAIHEKGEKTFECSKSFGNKNSVSLHKRRIHEENAKQTCIQCGKLFNKQYLKKHIETVHEGQKIHCNLCNQVFTQASAMKKHIKIIHEKTEKNLEM